MHAPGWGRSDVWILVAIEHAAGRRRRADLAGVLRAADEVNQTLPTHEELEGALRRLLGAHLAVEDDLHFAPTPNGRRLVREARGDRGTENFAEVEERLRALAPPREADWHLDEAAFEEACRGVLGKG